MGSADASHAASARRPCPGSAGAPVNWARTWQHVLLGSGGRGKGHPNPMSACQMKQAGKARRGESRQEGEKPWRRKGRGLGKVAAGAKVLAPCAPRKGLAVLIALKG